MSTELEKLEGEQTPDEIFQPKKDVKKGSQLHPHERHEINQEKRK